ncbi:Predicted phosphoribosyltransferase [Natronoarchaeum philippinense]|uniref:Predicted phosphoribosyltransferase n=1 Tax=Natronoarchaeum philippinense TaxID=558529 RepID=A0A285NB74_NATPI|nr:phosphoribosyltransferase family protein [Natronoarchaeum philippinense]SNZ05216.1 Predicted phosphoribosyltransferase [Natronoarchaeum philippinense]
MFQNRAEAGEQLADLLAERGVEADLVVGIPRGALPVARPVADRLDADLDVVVSKKMGAPHNEELAIGAVASDGSAWRNDDLIARLGVEESYVEREREQTAQSAREKLRAYRGTDEPPDVSGRRVVVVDDGVATGATARACLRQVRGRGAERVVLAVPVGSPDSLPALDPFADEVVAVETPPGFQAVGQFYRDFRQVTDAEARNYLDR